MPTSMMQCVKNNATFQEIVDILANIAITGSLVLEVGHETRGDAGGGGGGGGGKVGKLVTDSGGWCWTCGWCSIHQSADPRGLPQVT